MACSASPVGTLMRVCLVAVGTLSSVQPFIAIAQELKKLDIFPTIVCDEAYREFCEDCGVTTRSLRPSRSQLIEDTALTERELTAAIISDWKFVLDKTVLPYVPHMLEDLQNAYLDADLVITGNPAIVGRIAADAAGLPQMAVLVQPMALATADDPPVYPGFAFLPRLRRVLGPGAVRPFIALSRVVARRLLRAFEQVRLQIGAPPLLGDEAYDGPLASEKVFALYSPVLASLPKDAPGHVVQAGFTFFDHGPMDRGISGALASFLAKNPNPIIFTLGSLSVSLGEQFFEASANAAALLGRPAILMVGDEEKGCYRRLSSETVFVSGYVQHSQLFSHAAAVVHHGGIGTIAQAMRSGVLQLACPRYGDQFDNAYRLCTKGLGASLPLKEYTAERAVKALAALFGDPAFAVPAREVARPLEIENGAQTVAVHVREWFDRRSRPQDPGARPNATLETERAYA